MKTPTIKSPSKFINEALVEDMGERLVELLNAVGEAPVVSFALVAVTEPDVSDPDPSARHSFYMAAMQGAANRDDKVAFALAVDKELTKLLTELGITVEQLRKTRTGGNDA